MKVLALCLTLAAVPMPGFLRSLLEPTETTIVLDGEINDESATAFLAQLQAAESGTGDIRVEINTPGGDLSAAHDMAVGLEHAAAHNTVRCVVDGGALSAGFYLLESCQIRMMTRRSMLMAHEPFIPGAGGSLTSQQMAGLGNMLEAAARVYAEQCTARMSISADEFLERIHGRMWWIGADEALTLGAIDEIAPNPNAGL